MAGCSSPPTTPARSAKSFRGGEISIGLGSDRTSGWRIANGRRQCPYSPFVRVTEAICGSEKHERQSEPRRSNPHHRRPTRELQPDRQPPAQRRHRWQGPYRSELGGRRRVRPRRESLQPARAHFTSLPHVAIEGDTATVTSYLQILVPQTQGDPVDVPNHGSSKGFRVHRMTANRWELVRTPQGWKIKRRMLRQLDGSEPARKILRQAIAR